MGGLGDIGDVGMRGNINANANNSVGVENREASRISSQALERASQTGVSRANQNSVLAGTSSTTTVRTGALVGLTTGATLFSNGTPVGTVQQIRTTGNGSVAVVVVRGTNGGLYAIPASKLTLSGGTLSTTARLNGINANIASNSQGRLNSQGPLHASATGIAHANARSVLAGGAVMTSALPGLTTGLTVNTSTGTTLGRVSRVVVGTDGTIRQVIVTSSTGQVFTLSPAMLSISGGVVTTTQIG
jgi:sporulation protein YlmC with PRC-barrel domain